MREPGSETLPRFLPTWELLVLEQLFTDTCSKNNKCVRWLLIDTPRRACYQLVAELVQGHNVAHRACQWWHFSLDTMDGGFPPYRGISSSLTSKDRRISMASLHLYCMLTLPGTWAHRHADSSG